VKIPADPEESRLSRALEEVQRRRSQKTLHAVVVASEDSEVGEYSMPVNVSYDAEGQPFTTLDRVQRALVESAYGTMSHVDAIATREDRWLKDLNFDKEKAFELVLALAKGDDGYVEEAKRAASSAAW
jgi:hypothetical protein